MRPTILASLLSGLAAGLLGALIVVLLIDNDGSAALPQPQTVAQAGADVAPSDSPQDQPAADDTAGPLPLDLAAAIDRVRAAVVLITVEFPDSVDDQGRAIARGGIGTGVIFDDQGHILTNEHVVRGATRIQLRFHDGATRDAQLIGGDAPFTDLAVLRTDPAGLTPARFASASLRIGDTILAFGNALGNDAALTLGIVSNPNARFFEAGTGRQDYIQTDAALNPGNSGGPILNLAGDVVGLVAKVVTITGDGQTVQGVGFALAIDRILPIAQRIIATGGDFPRPDFGVVDQHSLDEFAAAQLGITSTEGAFLVEIVRTGVLAQAGVRPGDVIISLNGFLVTVENPYLNVLQQLQPGRPVDVVYLDQQGEEQVVEVIPSLRNR